MKHAEAVKDGIVAAGTVTTLSLYDTSLIVAIIVGVLTGIYTLIRIAHAIRKWHWEEKARAKINGVPPGTRPGELGS